MFRLLGMVACVALVALSACGQASGTDRASARTPVVAASTPAATPTPIPTPVPATPTPQPPPPAPPKPTLSLSFGPGTVTVAVTGIENGAHQVHVHRDCTGNPNLHLTTLGDLFVNPDGTGSRAFSLSPSLRSRGFDLLVYPPGASQGPPDLCSGV